jgi:hypothetical protein
MVSRKYSHIKWFMGHTGFQKRIPTESIVLSRRHSMQVLCVSIRAGYPDPSKNNVPVARKKVI